MNYNYAAKRRNRQISADITRWFYRRTTHAYPEFVVRVVLEKFKGLCADNQLSFAIPHDELRVSISEATCVMYHGNMSNKTMRGPHRTFPYPAGWTQDLEELWKDCLSHIFTNDMWELFWKTIHVYDLESDVPGWQQTIQELLPLYIMREKAILIRKGFLSSSQEPVEEEDYEEDA